MRIEIISGSPRIASITRRVALHLETELKQKSGHEIGLIDMRDWNHLPQVQNVFSSMDKTPEAFKPLAERIFQADAFILVTPEYNGSYSPALKNMLDHFPKQSRKVFGVVTASTGAMGGMRASQQMLLLVPALFGIASPSMLITPLVDKKFTEDGELVDENFRKNVDGFLGEFVWLAEAVASKKLVTA
ncbi:MAG: NAD(P)H-dependent oxidoreductase [Chitinophagaceae bacterium]|nr:NAD(P)H-dependent oxidoreductase [Chitinophagaceae bacterium]